MVGGARGGEGLGLSFVALACIVVCTVATSFLALLKPGKRIGGEVVGVVVGIIGVVVAVVVAAVAAPSPHQSSNHHPRTSIRAPLSCSSSSSIENAAALFLRVAIAS